MLPQDASHEPEEDTGWLAQFYIRPNRLFFPDPTELTLIGSVPVKMSAPKSVPGTALPTRLYPDPSGFLAMVTTDDPQLARPCYVCHSCVTRFRRLEA